ncbi:DUF1467 family protein [Paracoccus sp. p4-l81]|uniref:DUF1467 family protein n=1 Tax=unclassified Paracoccus (in: a-proteobacteria) TaxID=2688777 RepID=UPI0035B8F73E
MNLTGAIVLYAVVWFMVLFVILPIRLKTQDEVGAVVPGTPRSAPADAQIRRKAIWTTVIATLLWAAIAAVIVSGRVTLADIDWFNRLQR